MNYALLSRAVRPRRRRFRFAYVLAALPVGTIAVAGSGAPPVAAAPGDKVLIYFENAGHDAGAPRTALVQQATTNGYAAVEDGDSSEFTWTAGDVPGTETSGLGQFKAVIFVHNNMGTNPLTAAEKAAFESFTQAGGGSMFIHYALWSPPNWPFFERVAGATSGHHPERPGGVAPPPASQGYPAGNPGSPGVMRGTVKVYDTTSGLTAGLPSTLARWDEWYDWRINPANTTHTLVEYDEMTLGAGTDDAGKYAGRNGLVHPVTWCQAIEGGRQWTTGLGHSAAGYAAAYDSFNTNQLRLGMRYVVGDLAAPECANVPARDQQGSWSGTTFDGWEGVTPWPIMPINMALTADGKIQSFGGRRPTACATMGIEGYSIRGLLNAAGAGCDPSQGGQFEFDVWNPAVSRTLVNRDGGVLANTTYTDLFCSIQVLDPTRDVVFTAGGDDSFDGNAPNAGALGVTSYSTAAGLRNEAPMNYARWYPTATVMPNGDIVVQGGITSYNNPTGGVPVTTPERYSPTQDNGWTALTGATSAPAYSDGGQNRWWYPRSWVAPNGNLFGISGSQMYELNPSGLGTMTLRGTLPTSVTNQPGGIGTPIGATSTAAMYQPGKIVQMGGGGSGNNGTGGDGARAGFTVDLTTAGGTAAPVIAPIPPMKYSRHWANSTILPDGRVLVTGGARQNAAGISTLDGVVPAPEIWNPVTNTWSSNLAVYAHGRQYHSAAILLPDGRVMMGGGGSPGPGPYADVEYYTPDYLYDGNALAARPTIDVAPPAVAYGSQFQISVTGGASRVTMIRAGSVTHSFDNGQRFFEPTFTTNGSTLTINAPANGTIAPPGTWMIYAIKADGTPSVARLVEINPTTQLVSPTPLLVDQFDTPRVALTQGPGSITVAAGSTHLQPWVVTSGVTLTRAVGDGSAQVGYRLNLGTNGALNRSVVGLQPGQQYRISFKYARQSGVTVPGGGVVSGTVNVSGLAATVTATAANVANGTLATYTGTFTASASSSTLSLASTVTGTTAGLVIDDLVIFPTTAIPPSPSGTVRYAFDEGTGTASANTGTDQTAGAATLSGTATWTSATAGVFDSGVTLPGGASTATNPVTLPPNLLATSGDFTVSVWVKPTALTAWQPIFNIGNGQEDFFLIQSRAAGAGLAATFRLDNGTQTRVQAPLASDLTVGAWSHVTFTMSGSTGTLYLNGAQVAQATVPITMAAIGATANNYVGDNDWGDALFAGTIDDVRINRSTALTAAQVAALSGSAATPPVRYALDEGTGTVAANTGSDAAVGTGSLSGSATWTTESVFGSAVQLAGGAGSATNRINLPANVLSTSTDFSVSLWAKPDALPNWMPLLNIGNGTEDFFLIQSRSDTGASGLAATFRLDNGVQTRVQASLADDLTVGAWSHVVFTMSGSTGTLYLNGRQIAQGSIPVTMAAIGATVSNFVGDNDWGDPLFGGAVDDVRIYPTTVLTAVQVTALYDTASNHQV